ncbi:AMP-binding protein [Winogradskyella sp. 3972H.M.0a.05]|uniref:AMP-binding protein n=1 Tax=Winogradskyella sp. 3972H.M.0a.05 TaxID=2950277 RepID=UPI00339AE28C
MTPHYSKIHNRFRLDGRYFNHDALKEVAYSFVKEGLPYEVNIGDFLIDWLNDKSYVEVKTSGSTGASKTIRLNKQFMVNSAIATGDFFGLEPGQKALLCLPSNFIAGKMMLVRAMILGLEIDTVEPTTLPVFNHGKHYDFCAMIPMQLSNTINHLQNISTVIVGGAKVSAKLSEAIQTCPSRVYETYGMTETITHVAVKRLNGNSDTYFNILPNVSISLDERQCLKIDAPHLCTETIVTNDVVELHSNTEFELLGRFDNVINSGGLKINPEQIEQQLESKIEDNFFVSSLPDETLGEKLVLVLESEDNTLDASVFERLEKHHVPKEVICIPKFVYTASGKVQRSKTMAQEVEA